MAFRMSITLSFFSLHSEMSLYVPCSYQQEQWPDSRDGQFQGRSMGPADSHLGHKRQQVSLNLLTLLSRYCKTFCIQHVSGAMCVWGIV